MDIGKYVGLFLLKNEFCYLPGFGSLQVIKRATVFNKETQKTEAQGYEVSFVRGGGAIDDTFANFIANNERVSIAHAANHLKDYCTFIKMEFNEGNDVLIPGIGKFICNPEKDEILFVTDADLIIQGRQIPYFKVSNEVVEKKKEDSLSSIIQKTTFSEPKSSDEIVIKPAQVNWGKVALVCGAVVLIIGIVVFIIMQMSKSNDADITPPVVQETQTIIEDKIDQPTQNIVPATISDTNQSPQVNTATNNGIKIIVNSYTTKERAEARMKRLVSYSYSNLETVEHGTDSLKYHVVININEPVQDIDRTVDSVKKLLNPNGNVRLLK